MSYQIISDSSCDLGAALAAEKQITVVPFYVAFDEESYKKEIEEMGIRDFYQQMVDNPTVFPKSSMPSVQDYADVFTPVIERGEAVLCLCISSKFSGSLQSAITARDMLLEKYPEAQITVMDTMVNTVLQGIFVLEAVRLRDAGIPYEEAVARLEKVRDTGRIFFTVGSIDYLQHGGRIGKVAGAAVSVLGIKPLITLKEGEIFSSGVARGRKKSLDKVISLLKAYLEENHADIRDYSICIGYGYDYEEAQAFQAQVKSELASEFGDFDLPLFQIGATIAVHTGPYPLGVAIVKRT
ncbi:MAG: DegV family protein [Lachnospiraceae bacterium]|nr:DegV family protein [Lachnospiraceae bacterium]